MLTLYSVVSSIMCGVSSYFYQPPKLYSDQTRAYTKLKKNFPVTRLPLSTVKQHSMHTKTWSVSGCVGLCWSCRGPDSQICHPLMLWFACHGHTKEPPSSTRFSTLSHQPTRPNITQQGVSLECMSWIHATCSDKAAYPIGMVGCCGSKLLAI